MPTPLKRLSTPRTTRHSTGSVLVARPSAAQTPAMYLPVSGRTSFSRLNVGPSVAPNQGGGPAGGTFPASSAALSPPSGGVDPRGGVDPPGGGGGGGEPAPGGGSGSSVAGAS